MSIYCSYWDIGPDRPKKERPIIYAGSNVRPMKVAPRGGEFGISAIPDYITNRARDVIPWKPFLRVHVNNATVVLTRAQVEECAKAIARWLEDAQH
jgi:hypothetical protein